MAPSLPSIISHCLASFFCTFKASVSPLSLCTEGSADF
ncbi:hypothetical protein CCACVL1_01047 [Corchorus capsularis]|uniref:Uncharacterized protein n=1 Tax=Corchorus capsularis TaxID=210143 RepID=A0A1R3JN10_COCAP|nr:hypothetical protein CCACVL1_05044 [Corchorus capsularis]OMP09706.1 hypothetical protein CCACVL1_01047 [Corchorus capsularis]